MSAFIRPLRRGRRKVTAGAAAVGVLLGSVVALQGSAESAAAPRPTLSVSTKTISAGAQDTRVTVTGQSYLVPPHAEGSEVFGGVYVFFGWVKPGSWGPSAGGGYGTTYAYPGQQGDGGNRDEEDAIKFVSFTSGGASGSTTPYHMDDDGDWSAPIIVPGPTFSYTDGAGATHRVDCRKVTCGIFTIGAHGKVSSTNEVFTPLTFRAAVKPSTSKSPGNSPSKSPTARASSAAPGSSGSSQSGSTSGPKASTSASPSAPATSPGASQSLAVVPVPSSSVSPSASAFAGAATAGEPASESPARAVVALAGLVLLVGGGAGWAVMRARRAP